MTSLSRFVQDSVIVVRFLETECVGSLAFANPKSLHNFVTLSHETPKRAALRCPARKNDQGTLEAYQSPYTNALSCFPRVPATNSFNGTNRQHVVHMHSNANVQFSVHKQTRIALILNTAMFFQLARQIFLSRRCSETQHGLSHSPHVCHPSESLGSCACNCSPSRISAVRKVCVCCLPQKLHVPDLVCRDTLPKAYGCPVLLL